MTNLIVELAKYILIILICFYTYQSFNVFRTHDIRKQNKIFFNQNYLMFLLHLMGYLVIYIKTEDRKVWMFYGAQVALLLGILLFYSFVYRKSSRLITNNMCMLLTISFIILTRIDFESSVRQFFIVAAAVAVTAVIPALIQRMRFFRNLGWVYGAAGIAMLGIVAVFSLTSYGAKLSFTIAGVTIQPSEFVKLIFVFFVASMFYRSKEKKQVLITTAVAAAHVMILVLSRDLGMGLIFFVVYMVMLYAGTKNRLLTAAGIAGGCAASVVAYKLFSHVRVRVLAWKDPFGNYDNGGYQVAQSLFAIGTGGWFGMGLYQGSPSQIPVVKKDFIFSAIVEEMGAIFGICLILICLSCFVMFVNIAIQMTDEFYKLVALGLGAAYAFQVFLTIGGGIKFIPLTGVTLPLISMGGSSMLSTLAMFAIIQGMYIMREDEEGEELEREPQQGIDASKKRKTSSGRAGNSGSGKRRREAKASGPKEGRQKVRAKP
ncbi:MAG: FtsW/RodA/SpoVE family cell cycle protein [Lachnospiraceae bacterium]|nr:FtsW/RodA/SpoVE family cell cycle protein [Lachnospiraceae bacterium]